MATQMTHYQSARLGDRFPNSKEMRENLSVEEAVWLSASDRYGDIDLTRTEYRIVREKLMEADI